MNRCIYYIYMTYWHWKQFCFIFQCLVLAYFCVPCVVSLANSIIPLRPPHVATKLFLIHIYLGKAVITLLDTSFIITVIKKVGIIWHGRIRRASCFSIYYFVFVLIVQNVLRTFGKNTDICTTVPHTVIDKMCSTYTASGSSRNNDESTTNNDVEHIVKMTLMTMLGESFIGGKSTFLVFHATYSPYEKTADFHTNKKDSQTSTLSQVHSWIYMNTFSFNVLFVSEFWNIIKSMILIKLKNVDTV